MYLERYGWFISCTNFYTLGNKVDKSSSTASGKGPSQSKFIHIWHIHFMHCDAKNMQNYKRPYSNSQVNHRPLVRINIGPLFHSDFLTARTLDEFPFSSRLQTCRPEGGKLCFTNIPGPSTHGYVAHRKHYKIYNIT
jgi:hypothetical protein